MKAETFQGPQVSQLQFDRIMGYINDGKKAGAKVVAGGERLGSQGYYIKPTIFANVKEDMSIVKEEIFGPVCTVQKFSTEEEAIQLANDTNYGTLLFGPLYCYHEQLMLITIQVWLQPCIPRTSTRPFACRMPSRLGKSLVLYCQHKNKAKE